jgi:hypothetical protein
MGKPLNHRNGSAPISILVSGIGLGFYTPGLSMRHRLRQNNFSADVVVFESLLNEEKKKKIPAVMQSFQRNFKMALAGQKLTRDIRPHLNHARVLNLLDAWASENRRHFIVTSGFFIPVLELYANEYAIKPLRVDLCHFDASDSVSFKLYPTVFEGFRHIRFYDLEHGRINCQFRLSDEAPLPFENREDRYFIHGGGWGLGSYAQKIPLLEKRGLKLDIALNASMGPIDSHRHNRYFAMPSDWYPWTSEPRGEPGLPPWGEVGADGRINYQAIGQVHGAYQLVRENRAIISKPGAATLIESLSAATPLILLESFGDYEEKNARLWEHLGLGIAFDTWVADGCSIDILESMHTRLMRIKEATPDYIDQYWLQIASHETL